MKEGAGKGFRGSYRELTLSGKLVLWAALLLSCYAALGFLALPLAARLVLEKKLPEILHRPVTIDNISLNPFRLTLVVEGFRIRQKEGGGSFGAFDRLFVNLEALSLLKKALIVKELTLAGPRLEFSRLAPGTYSFSDLLAGGGKTESGKTGPFYFAIQNIMIDGGQIIFHDQPKGGEHTITDLNLAIPALSNLPYQVETYVQPAFSAIANGTPFSLKGESKPFAKSLETVVSVKIDGLNLPEYQEYIPNRSGLFLQSARLDVNAGLHLLARPDSAYRLALQGRVALRDLAVTDREGQVYLQMPELAVTLADSDLLAGEIRLTEVIFDQPSLRIERLGDGRLLPAALLAEAKVEAPPVGTSPSQATAKLPENTEKDGMPVDLRIDRLLLEKGHIEFLDEAVVKQEEGREPVRLRLDNLVLLAESISTAQDQQGSLTLSCDLNEGGKFQARGSLGLQPFQLALHLDLASLALQPFQPYISQQARIVVAGGALSVTGDLAQAPLEAGGLQSGFQGRAELAGLATVDTVHGEDLLKWQNLGISEISYSSDPGSLAIGAIKFDQPYTKVLIGPDGVVNLSTIRPGQPPAVHGETAPSSGDTGGAPAAAPRGEPVKKPPFATKVGSLAVRGGQVDFVDQRVTPAYGASLAQISGGISGLSSKEGTSAPVDFSAQLDGQAPLRITGRINPLSKDLLVDLKVDFSDINLSPMSPYTGKYLGYKTDKGKLNLDLKYDITGSRLVSDNKAFLDQFTLGETVDSPDAAKLPISLAIALLKNRQGEIHLDVPVQGDLNDPDFRLGGVIIQVLVNLVAKAATSPFALLGALIPEGQDLQYISFGSGSADFDQVASDKLVTLAKVLYERPGLRMDIIGKVDPGADGAALAQAHLVNSVKLQKLLASGQGRAAADKTLPEEGLGREEYLRYLPAAYAAARKASPGRQPAAGPATPESMESYILAGIRVGEEELRLLALERANRVLANLVASGQVEPERLFVVAPVLGGEGEAGGASQVELVIK